MERSSELTLKDWVDAIVFFNIVGGAFLLFKNRKHIFYFFMDLYYRIRFFFTRESANKRVEIDLDEDSEDEKCNTHED